MPVTKVKVIKDRRVEISLEIIERLAKQTSTQLQSLKALKGMTENDLPGKDFDVLIENTETNMRILEDVRQDLAKKLN